MENLISKIGLFKTEHMPDIINEEMCIFKKENLNINLSPPELESLALRSLERIINVAKSNLDIYVPDGVPSPALLAVVNTIKYTFIKDKIDKITFYHYYDGGEYGYLYMPQELI